MSTNKTLARKRARKNARRTERRVAVMTRQVGRVQPARNQTVPGRLSICVLCAAACEQDGVLHESDCNHEWLLCPCCAVRTCDDCISKPEIVARARRRDPAIEVAINAGEVARLNDKLSGLEIGEVAEPLRMFMNMPVPCGTPCNGAMVYVDGSERWPSQAEQASMADVMLAYDRACAACGRRTTSMLGGPSFDDDDDSDEHATMNW